ncbi:hypothetical protein [Paenibacillus sp. Lou8.1]|uniref:hypothetical protein n=1 Tax=Paenibacillus sp. Lou8.1 TaxID=2962041 RepID=UPI0020B83E7F|nr:hypothetical protein [Paenibacillus sp. Lou8.1]
MVKLNGEAKYYGCNKRLNVQSEIKITRKGVTFFKKCPSCGLRFIVFFQNGFVVFATRLRLLLANSLTYRLDFTGTGVPFLNRVGLLGILLMPESSDLEGNALRVVFVVSKLWLVLLNSTV